MFDEEPMFDNGTEKHQNDVKAPSRLQSFVYPGKSRKRDYRTSQRPSIKDSLQKSVRNGHHSSTSLNETIDKCTRYGYGNVYKSEENRSTGSSGNENDLVNDNNHYIFGAFSSIIDGNGDTFQTHSEFDRSSVISEMSDDFLNDYKLQPWMDKITGGTFRRDYLDKNLFRPTLQHDSSISLQNARRIGFIENRSVETQTQDPYLNEKRNGKKTNKTCLVIIFGLLLIACIVGVLAWFLAKKGEDEFSVKYYVVSGEMALTNEFYPELSNSSSKEFKDLGIQFCGAITDSLRKNNTEFGDLYRHCDVTKFKNGSIIVQYRLYYQYNKIQITKEKVYQDLNNSLTYIDSGLANFSDFVIIKASVSFLVEVQTFKTDPLVTSAPLITPTTTSALTELKTTAMSSNVTTLLTDNTTEALTTEGTTESIPTTLASEITTRSDPSTFTTEDTTENKQASLITEITTESYPTTLTADDTNISQSKEARVETSQSFTETVTDQTSTTLNTLNSTTMETTEYQTASTIIETSDNPTSPRTDKTEIFAQPTTLNKTEISTTVTATSTNFKTSESLRMTSTTFSATTTSLEYSADIVVSPVIAIYGETATAEVCAFTPHGDWLYATLTVEYQNRQYVIGTFHSNSSLEERDSLDRFNISMFRKNMDIVVHLTLNLQTPTTDTCSLDEKYTFTCSITMNDTLQTLESNGSQIFITAPMSEINIDSEVNYNEGEKMTFNCSMKGDPNYSTAYVELIKNSQILHTIPGPMFGSDYISDCSAVLNWSGGPPNPLTTQEHDLIVRCVVKNKLLNETRNSEKKLNVSAADVAFTKYSYKALSNSLQEIECIARSPISILQELIISKDDVQIATLNSSGVASSTDGRYSTYNHEYNGEVRLTLSISSVDCQDQGQYNCKLITTNNATRVSPEMSIRVEGSKPTLALHPDIYEPFARLGLNHVCSTEHVGDKNNDNFLEIQIFKPGSQRPFTYSKKIAEVEKMFDFTNNITYINITGTTAQFLLVSHTSSSSNLSCNIKETITFLLDLKMDFDNGTIKCVLKDEMEEFSAVESTITVIPGNFCDGYENGAFRKHPNTDCNDYIECTEHQEKMYATGNQCPLGQCIKFTTRSCVPCDSTFACDELTTPGPTTTTTTLPPGRRYVSCNDSAHFLGTTAVIKCVILNTSFNSLNITFRPEESQNEEYVGEVFPDGQVQSLPQSSVVLSTNFDLSPKILMFTFQLLECSSRGRYRIIAEGTNSSVAPSVETFELDVLGNLTEFEMRIEPAYPEGTLVEFNCTASLDESHANIKGYYKKESGSSFSEIKGTTTVIERNLSHCFVKVLWKPSTPYTADTSFHNADLKCELGDWPLIQPTKKISVQNADVAFETYKLESSIGSQVSVKCFARNTNSIKSILIRKIENSVNTTVANVTLPDMTSHVDGTTVSYTNNSLTLTFSSLACSDDGHYTCIVIKDDKSQIESPAYLRVQIKNPPKHETVTFILHPDIRDDKYDTSNVHTCSGDVGYPSGLGYLSLKFTDPATNASFTYDKMTVTDDMKIALEPPLKFKVSLATGLSIIIVEDKEPDEVNCTRKKEIKFLLQATIDWNKAKIRCRVVSETTEVNSTSVEKEMYVIPDAVCDGSNGSDVYVPHEKIDGCRTYIRCFNNKPTGHSCGELCFDHQKKYCDWCRDVACESEMSSTTEEQITTYSTPMVPEIPCPFLSCNPTSVFEMETGNIVCVLNTSMRYDNITVMKTGQTIMTVYSNGTNYYYLDNFEKYESTVGTSFTFGIKNVSCSDKDEYTFTVDVDGGRCSKTASLDIKHPPKNGKVTFILHPDIKDDKYDTSNVHTCSGDVGFPSSLGYLSLKFTNPTTNASFTYDIMTVTEDMKIAKEPPLKFKVSLASGLSIIIVKDDEPDSVNCTRKKEIKFLLQATIDWNKAKIRCSVVSETTEVNSTSVEKEMYVIPDGVCDGSNGSDVYVPHEKIDGCKSYIRCFNNKPTGHSCGELLCFDHQNKYCGWCRDVACESEMSSTTEEQITTTYSTPMVPEIQ